MELPYALVAEYWDRGLATEMFGCERDVVYAGLPHVLCRITATG